jgi:ATP synthase protein I
MTGNDAAEGRGKTSDMASDQDLSRRLERLGADLEAKRPAAAPEGSAPSVSTHGPSAFALAFRASTEFVAGVIVGGGVGWAFDKGLGTSPWGLIVFLLLGFAAGIYNVMRSSGFLKPASAATRSTTRDH